ncbi:WD40 repeat protein [Kitasatospora acidiphila]
MLGRRNRTATSALSPDAGDFRALSPDGRTVAGVREGQLLLWDAVTNTLKSRLVGNDNDLDWAQCVAFSPDGKALAFGSGNDHKLRLWSPDSGAPAVELATLDTNVVTVSFAHDAKGIITGNLGTNGLHEPGLRSGGSPGLLTTTARRSPATWPHCSPAARWAPRSAAERRPTGGSGRSSGWPPPRPCR